MLIHFSQPMRPLSFRVSLFFLFIRHSLELQYHSIMYSSRCNSNFVHVVAPAYQDLDLEVTCSRSEHHSGWIQSALCYVSSWSDTFLLDIDSWGDSITFVHQSEVFATVSNVALYDTSLGCCSWFLIPSQSRLFGIAIPSHNCFFEIVIPPFPIEEQHVSPCLVDAIPFYQNEGTQPEDDYPKHGELSRSQTHSANWHNPTPFNRTYVFQRGLCV